MNALTRSLRLILGGLLITLTARAAGPLNGTYNVGGFAPDFETLAALCEYLNTNGVSGPVAVYIAPGEYTDPISLHSVPGTSSVNTITFQPAGDSLAVMIKSIANDFNFGPYAVWLDNTNHVTIRNLNFSVLAYGTSVIRLDNGSSNIRVVFNNIYGTIPENEDNAGSFNDSGIGMFGTQPHSDILIRGNNISRVNNGIVSTLDAHLINPEISRNHITNYSSYGMFLPSFNGNMKVINNHVNFSRTFNHARGSEIRNTYNGFEFSGNRITGDFGYGAFFSFLGSKGSPLNSIANNMIVGGPNALIGLAVDDSYNTNVIYNSVTIGTDEPVTYAAEFTNDSLTSVLNNIFVANAGFPLVIDQFFFPDDYKNVFDYNDYRTNGSFFFEGPRNLEPVTTLAEWRDKTPWDDHSVSIDPEFISATDLHTNNPSIDGLAMPVAYPLDDFDKEPRSSSPDIGADESVLFAADAAVYSIVTDNICSETSTLFVRIRNHSFNTLTSVTIKWSVNGVAQTPKAWTGNLAKGQLSGAVPVGTFNFVGATAYTIQMQTQEPNGTPDMNTANDTKTVDNIFSSVKGVYTIGPGGNFTTMQQAIDVLNTRGVCGPATFNIMDGTYTGHYLLKQIPGAGPDSRVVFQSQSRDRSKVILAYDATTAEDDYILKLDGTDFITIRDIGFKPTNATLGTAILYAGVVEHTMIDHCYFSAPVTTVRELLRCDAAYLSASSIKFNRFEGGYSAATISLEGSVFPGIAEVDSLYYNEMIDQYYQGIAISAPSRKLVEGNKVHTSVGQSGFTGMVVWGNDGSVINNIVQGRNIGIHVAGCGNFVANNFVTVTGNQPPGGAMGLYIFACGQTTVGYNNILNTEAHTGSAAITIFGDVAENTVIKNNNFVTDGPGIPLQIFGLNGLLVSDYNNLVTNGNRIVVQASQDFATLADWRASSFQDVHSISADPAFVSDTDLHIQNSYLTGRGKNLPGVTKDIDGEARHPQYPTIGADEFGVPVLNDIAYVERDDAFLCDRTKPIKVTFANTGLLPVTSFRIGWKKNGVGQPDKIFNGTLEPEQQTIIEFSNDFNDDLAYSLEVTSTEVNGTADSAPANDDVVISFTLYSHVTLGNDIAACDGDNVVLDAGAGYSTYDWSDGSHNQAIQSLQTGSYSVTVKDVNGCTSQDDVQVAIYTAAPSISAVGGKNVVCEGSTISLKAIPDSEGPEYEWRRDDDIVPEATSGIITIDQAGTYKVSVSLAGCEFTSDPLLITQSATPSSPPIVVDGPAEFCEGGSVKLSAPPDFAAYQWSNNGTTRDQVIATSGDLSVKVVNENGCMSEPSEIIHVNVLERPQQPVITVVGALEFCDGGSVQLKAPAGFQSYRWSTDAASQNVTISESGNYSVKVVDANGCESLPSANATVLVHPLPPVTITVGNDKLIATGGTSYKWFRDGVEVPNETSSTLTPSQSGTYRVIAFSGICSATSDDVVYTINGLFESGDWKVYPNPVSGKMTIAGPGVGDNTKITLEDGLGRLFRMAIVSASSDRVMMDVSEMSVGVYLLKVDTGEATIRTRVVIVR